MRSVREAQAKEAEPGDDGPIRCLAAVLDTVCGEAMPPESSHFSYQGI
ncbi:hypothetical protein SSAG_00168 [Streptomyces sp. Mg1]|nr:hypothetical protein SSAG_00168 [Streptomyces sp. Mg1]